MGGPRRTALDGHNQDGKSVMKLRIMTAVLGTAAMLTAWGVTPPTTAEVAAQGNGGNGGSSTGGNGGSGGNGRPRGGRGRRGGGGRGGGGHRRGAPARGPP